MRKIEGLKPLSGFGECVIALARKHGYETNVALRRALASTGYEIKDRSFASYLYGRAVVDPALPIHLVRALKLNKKEMMQLANAYTYGQPPRARNRQEKPPVLQEVS